MYLIVGLGNPGKKYELTRHNMGFITVERLAEKEGIKISRAKFKSLMGEGMIGGEKVVLLKPQTYMNLSGEAVREAFNYFKIEPEKMMVVYDDIDIPLGSLRIRKSGSAGTHNGMRSVIYQLGIDDFPRMRIGIGEQEKGKGDLISHVIGKVTEEEKEVLRTTIDSGVEAIRAYITDGIDLAMNRFNTGKHEQKDD